MLSRTRGSPAATDLDLRPARGSDGAATDTETPSANLDPRRTYGCPTCGHVLRVIGLGRHRVYFELTDELLDDPVMERVCPVCGLGLPGK
jgi:hypothetical protein